MNEKVARIVLLIAAVLAAAGATVLFQMDLFLDDVTALIPAS